MLRQKTHPQYNYDHTCYRDSEGGANQANVL